MQRLAWMALWVLTAFQTAGALTQDDVPAIYHNILIESGQPVVVSGNKTLRLDPKAARPDYTVRMLKGAPKGTESGFVFTFTDVEASETLAGGSLFYSLWDPQESRYPMPHYRFAAPIDERSQARVNMSNLTGRYDLSGWETSGKGILYYRVTNAKGAIAYEGKVFFTSKPFKVGASITAGPWTANVTHDSAVIAFETNRPVIARVVSVPYSILEGCTAGAY